MYTFCENLQLALPKNNANNGINGVHPLIPYTQGLDFLSNDSQTNSKLSFRNNINQSIQSLIQVCFKMASTHKEVQIWKIYLDETRKYNKMFKQNQLSFLSYRDQPEIILNFYMYQV